MYRIYLVSCLVLVRGGPARNEKDQFCTDPRTMAQHAAYTEWADAYSCTRHRCQPGGRNLAIYTVGCKRVEAPESAIECEEVVEDTNMQFPYCCTRLRCLVVVRGEVWTRVLGQPWETLPAAPWSHMYKMKKPPPGESFQKKGIPLGPVYELMEPSDKQSLDTGPTLRAKQEKEICDEPVPRAAASPDIVIALTTSKDKKPNVLEPRSSNFRNGDQFKHGLSVHRNEIEPDEEVPFTDKDGASDEQYLLPDDSRRYKNPNEVSDELSDAEKDIKVQKEPRFPEVSEEEKPGSLQTLVDAIGNRMRDIENVVQKMSEQVAPFNEQDRTRARVSAEDHDIHDVKNLEAEVLGKRKKSIPDDFNRVRARDSAEDHDINDGKTLEAEVLGKRMKSIPDDFNRLPSHAQGNSRYLNHNVDTTTVPPIFAEDPNLHGYFSDPSNTMRRANRPKEPAIETYMVPVDTNHRNTIAPDFGEPAIKHKKHLHKKKKSKHGKKKHRRDDTENKFDKIPTSDIEKNGLSMEDSSGFGKA